MVRSLRNAAVFRFSQAQAEADYQDGLADQISTDAEQRSLENAGFLQDAGTLSATRSHDITAQRLSYSAGNITRSAAFSAADKQQLVPQPGIAWLPELIFA